MVKQCRATYVRLQQVVHGDLRQLFRLVELLKCLPELLIRDLPLTLLLVVQVQPAALQLLQVVLQSERG